MPGENFAKLLNANDLTMISHVRPFLTCQLLGFMTMNLYGGVHGSGNQWKHEGT
jgi:hypothetical protein